jgi:hypothetical protein
MVCNMQKKRAKGTTLRGVILSEAGRTVNILNAESAIQSLESLLPRRGAERQDGCGGFPDWAGKPFTLKVPRSLG